MVSLIGWPERQQAQVPSQSDRRAIIDIGSNSVRLVVYGGSRRAPSILFNEKVMAGLGAELQRTGRLGEAAKARTMAALARFQALCTEMGVVDICAVATAAVRDAANGQEILDSAQAMGLTVNLLSGVQEAQGAAMGVLSAFPDASGIVGDLGGGSLELARVHDGMVRDETSLPLGVLRIDRLLEKGGSVDEIVADALAEAGWRAEADVPALYLVGGTWRNFAKLHMTSNHYPLRMIHGYAMTPKQVQAMTRKIVQTGPETFAASKDISSARIPTLKNGALLLDALVRQVSPERVVTSSYGLREGLILSSLDAAERAKDPLLIATAGAGAEMGRFPLHGRIIDQWLDNLFPDDGAEARRIRAAACNLGDVAWRANPDFRAERGVEIALHGNWVAIDATGRAMLAQALFTTFGGGPKVYPGGIRLASEEQLDRAIAWGLAIRLAQRLSGGTAMPLEHSRLSLEGEEELLLTLDVTAAALAGEAVEKRLRQLAQKLGRRAELRVGSRTA